MFDRQTVPRNQKGTSREECVAHIEFASSNVILNQISDYGLQRFGFYGFDGLRIKKPQPRKG